MSQTRRLRLCDRAFVRMRNELLANTTLEKRLMHIEKALLAHDAGLRDIYGLRWRNMIASESVRFV